MSPNDTRFSFCGHGLVIKRPNTNKGALFIPMLMGILDMRPSDPTFRSSSYSTLLMQQ